MFGISLIAITIGAQPLSAQTTIDAKSLQGWMGRTLVSAGTGTAELEIEPPKGKAWRLALPGRGRLKAVTDSEVLASKRTAEGTWMLWRTRNLKTWEKAGFIKEDESRFLSAYPLKNGKYLITRAVMPFRAGDQRSYVALYRPKEGTDELVFDRPVDLGLDIILPAGKDPLAPSQMATARPGFEDAVSELLTPHLLSFPGGCALVVQSLGKVLVFDDETGSLRRTNTLFSSIDDPRKPGDLLERAILQHRALPGGRILLATRSEDAILNARRIFQDHLAKAPETPTPPLPRFKEDGKSINPAWEEAQFRSAQARFKAQEGVRKQALEAFPDILWWEYDPDTGDFIKLSTPLGLPGRLWNWDSLKSFSFRINRQGKPEPE